MGEAGQSPALSRNCSSRLTRRARIPASAGVYTAFAERGWRMKGRKTYQALPQVT